MAIVGSRLSVSKEDLRLWDWHKLQIVMLGSSVHTVPGCSGMFRDIQGGSRMFRMHDNNLNMEWMEDTYGTNLQLGALR